MNCATKTKYVSLFLVVFFVVGCGATKKENFQELVSQFSLNEPTDNKSTGFYLIGDDCYCPSWERYEVKIGEEVVFVNVRSHKFLIYEGEHSRSEINFRLTNYGNEKQAAWQPIEILTEKQDLVFILFYDGKYRVLSEKEAKEKMVALDLINEKLKG